MQRAVERFFQLSLLGLVTAGFLAVAGSGFLDTPTVILVSLGLVLRGATVVGWLALDLPDLAVNIITLAYIAFFALDYFFLSRGLLEATVHLVCFLAVMKVLTARTDRDFLYTASIALLELVAAAMLSVNLNFFAYLSVYLVCAIAAATSAEIRRGLRGQVSKLSAPSGHLASRLSLVTALITAGILLLTVAMFILLPRIRECGFSTLIYIALSPERFSNQVTLGDIGEIQKDSRPVMHIMPYSQQMPGDLKWRGISLSRFDGHKWSDSNLESREVLPRKSPIELAGVRQRSRRDGRRFSYRVDLNLTDSDVLFTAGIPEFIILNSGRVARTANSGLHFSSGNFETVRYEVSSFIPFSSRPATVGQLASADRARDLELPPLDPRIAPLARELATPLNIERYLRTHFGYTLDLPDSPQPDPLANFLFDRRKGHCEYFASAMTIMLRTLGTPARLVNGFQSGTFNPINGLYVIRASDAHSWVEAWIPGSGWTTFDPTPRIPREPSSALMARFGLYLDAAQTFWQEWVINYDLSRQITLAERLQESTQQVNSSWNPDFPLWRKQWTRWANGHRTQLFTGAAVLALLPIFVLFALRLARRLWQSYKLKSGRMTHADAAALYQQMLRVLRTRGYEKPSWFTAAEFSASLPPSPLAVRSSSSQLLSGIPLRRRSFRPGRTSFPAGPHAYALTEVVTQSAQSCAQI